MLGARRSLAMLRKVEAFESAKRPQSDHDDQPRALPREAHEWQAPGMEGRAECAVVGCTNVRYTRQQCVKHARRLFAYKPLHDVEPEPPAPAVCEECGRTWDRPPRARAHYCSDTCRYAYIGRRLASPNLERDAAIRAAVARGELHREVAARHGISAPRVWQIVNGWVSVDERREPQATPR